MSFRQRILIVDDDRRMAKTLADVLKVKGYQTEVAHSGPEALDKVEQDPLDCVLTDIKMPGMNGVKLYQKIREIQPELPVVFMTAYAGDELVKKGLEEGAVGVLTKPLDVNRLLGFFASLVDERPIVIVDDDFQFCRTLGGILRERGYEVAEITDPEDIEKVVDIDGQMVLLDMKLNGKNGLDVLRQIRKKHPQMPIVIVTGYKAEMASQIEAAIAINAYTCLYKPVQIEELLKIINQIHHHELGRLLS